MNRLTTVTLLALVMTGLAACAPATSAQPPSSPVVGVVTKVDSSGLNEVSSFDLRTDDGLTFTFEAGDLENPVEFPPGHLREHMATSSPVSVFFEVDGDRLLVTRLEDAE